MEERAEGTPLLVPQDAFYLAYIRLEDLDLSEPENVGQGKFATVFKVKYRGVPVALKVLHSTQQGEKMEVLPQPLSTSVWDLVKVFSSPSANRGMNLEAFTTFDKEALSLQR